MFMNRSQFHTTLIIQNWLILFCGKLNILRCWRGLAYLVPALCICKNEENIMRYACSFILDCRENDKVETCSANKNKC
jgi:hypothetical protein